MDDQHLAELLAKACPRPSHLASTDGGPALALALHCLFINEGFVLAPEGGQGSTDPDARFVPHKDWNSMLMDQWVFTYTKPGKARKFTLHCSLQARTKRMFVHSCEENNLSNVCVLGLQLDNYVPHPEALRSNNWAAGAEPAAPAGGAEAEASGEQQQQQPLPGSSEPRPVVRNAAKMYELMSEYVFTPLLQAAEEEQGPPPPSPPPAEGRQQRRQSGGDNDWLAPLRSGSWLWRKQQQPAGQGQRQRRPPLAPVDYLAVGLAVGAAVGVAALVLSRRKSPALL